MREQTVKVDVLVTHLGQASADHRLRRGTNGTLRDGRYGLILVGEAKTQGAGNEKVMIMRYDNSRL